MDNSNFSDLGQILYALKENPQMMQMLMGMMGASAPQKSEPRPPAPDLMSLLSGIQKNTQIPPPSSEKSDGGILGSPEENKKRINLLNAVRPYLSESRQSRVDTVIKLLKLAELGGLSSILGGK